MFLGRHRSLINVTAAFMLLGLAIVAAYMLYTRQRVPWVMLAIVPTILGGWHYHARMSKWIQWAYTAFLVILVVALVWRVSDRMALALSTHIQGDFKHFWISARAAISGNNFYDPANLHAVLNQLDPREATPVFVRRLVDTGFWYPPMSMLLFLPLGLFDLQTAWIIGYVILTVVFLVTIRALQKTFLSDSGWLGYLVLLALMLVLFPTGIVLEFSQTDFLLMLLVILFWVHRDRPAAGVWLGLGIIIKPFVAMLILFLLLRKHWRASFNVILTLGVLSVISILLFGPDVFLSYRPNLPPSVFHESINAGLMRVIIYLVNFQFDGHSPIFHPLFLASAFILTAITAWVVYSLPKNKDHWAVSLLLMLSLLLYPTALRHYTVFFVLPLLWMWTDKENYPGGLIGVVSFITLEYTLLAYQRGFYSFYPILLCWLCFLTLGLRYLYVPNFGRSTLAPLAHWLPVSKIQKRLTSTK